MFRTSTYSLCALVALLSIAIGCSKSDSNRVVGTWSADFSSVELVGEEAAAIPEAQRTEIMGMLAAGEMTLTLNDDNTYQVHSVNPMNGEVEDKTGTWSITAEEGDIVTVTTTQDAAEGETGETKTRVLTFDGDTVFTMDEEMLRITMRRQ